MLAIPVAPILDASWVVQFVVLNQNYTITFRGLQYNFGSVYCKQDFSSMMGNRSMTVVLAQ
jgi:hypothetical protein